MGVTTTLSHDHVRMLSIGRAIANGTPAEFTISDLGFTPKYLRATNVSERVTLEAYQFMNAREALKTVAAGTRTKITTNGLTLTERAFTVHLDTGLLPTHGASNNENLIELYASA